MGYGEEAWISIINYLEKKLKLDILLAAADLKILE